ncbi:ketoacyl-ACP synthase III [Staphylospora marina]|uniref:ketoacyl-ACP synthase III n=1 Tax=Staphylospora marina TaxID=2490858 RepID=UPI001F150139|nr:ketoacyl-ACP synthase III [Staphylospora marina]
MTSAIPVSQARISAIGTHVPERVLTNRDLERLVETSDEWIVQRTGIHERRIAANDEFTSDLCVKAVENLVERHQVRLADIDFVIVSTATPDAPFPSVASQVHHRLGLSRTAGAIDISAACAGFVHGLNMANALITSEQCRKVLVIGAETLSKITDYTDRTTCILFGDAAGAVLVEHDSKEPSFIRSVSTTDGSAGIHLYCSGIADRIGGKPILRNGKLVQNGREVFKIAVHTLVREIPPLLAEEGLTPGDLDLFVPHSANIRIIEAVCSRIGIPMEKVLFSATRYGNTSSASIPLALKDGMDAGKLKRGDLVLLSGFGGGFVHTSTLIRWTI